MFYLSSSLAANKHSGSTGFDKVYINCSISVEFKERGSFEEITAMVGGGFADLEPGQWTEDTSMALCLAESLLEDGFSIWGQLEKYLRWYNEGYLSSTLFRPKFSYLFCIPLNVLKS